MVLFLFLGCLAAQLQAASPTTQAAVARPTQEVPQASCVTAQCHTDVKNFKVLHGPVNVNACDSCHTVVDAKAHTFKLARAERDLCTFCHEMNLADAPVVHKPVMDGQCSSCHNPHGGKTRSMTRGASVRDVCISCHNNGAAGMKYVHGPVASGACDSCHTSHKSNFKKLLNTEGNDLCFQCHGEMRRQLGEAKVKHKAVEGSCLNCHDAHASNFVMQTKKPAKELCLSCHEKNLKDALSSKYVHQPVVDDKGCLNCHTSHGGMIAALMKDEPSKLCVGCHSAPVKTPDGRKINSVAEIANPNLVKHGPIREGDCSGCHATHGSNVEKLLAKPYPAAFYQPYSDDKYALCFSCHDKQLVQTPEARGLTNFRNGDTNLHFLHVNREKGRNCRSCHDTHASANELHIRESVPFGNWQMPINFKKTVSGGGCSPALTAR
jgi:predicted CXXCH cytochrome family protein